MVRRRSALRMHRLRTVLLRTRRRLRLDNKAGDQIPRKTPVPYAGRYIQKISPAHRSSPQPYRASKEQGLHLSSAVRRFPQLFCLSGPPKSMQNMALLGHKPSKLRHVEFYSGNMSRNKPRKILQLSGDRKTQKTEPLVAMMKTDDNITSAVASVYEWIDSKAAARTPCNACGNCCDFKQYDHRLYVTAVELQYLVSALGPQAVKKMSDGICPYNENNKCTIHKDRFAGCRIFSCRSDTDFQSRITEQALAKLKSIGNKFNSPYQYVDLATGLNSLTEQH